MKSQLCTYDLTHDRVHVVLTTNRHIEAPNWTPDGTALVVNGGGRLWRVDLANPGLRAMDTGAAVRLNNDHGISPDGAWLYLTDKCEEDGESVTYRCRADGSGLERMTPEFPSYWHGVSPDGRTITYVGKRGGRFDIYVRPASGGPETRLTSGFDHCDGPDYSADGHWIWFNGEGDGTVELWRVHPDGSGLEKMTEDRAINWFPHPSPDGRHVLYVAYPEGTTGHPGGRDVELRLLDQAGGPTRGLVALWGGQGTINVPCWAPDSSAFAFMRFLK